MKKILIGLSILFFVCTAMSPKNTHHSNENVTHQSDTIKNIIVNIFDGSLEDRVNEVMHDGEYKIIKAEYLGQGVNHVLIYNITAVKIKK